MKERIKFLTFKIVRNAVELFYPRPEIIGAENLPDEPCIIVGNHCKMNGPIISELYLPNEPYTWCASQMMEMKEVPAYAYQDFWSAKPRGTRWFYRLLSHAIAPLSVSIFTNARTIPVYRDMRTLATFRQTIQRLTEGSSIVIFPEHYVDYNHIICEFQENFIEVARLFHHKTGQILSFVPMYITPVLKKVCFGAPVRYNPEAPFPQERSRICNYLMQEVTHLAMLLPRHRVVPYQNLPRRKHPFNTLEEVSPQ